MIYLDNSATSFPKPQSVKKAINDAVAYGANPGRSGHKASLYSSKIIYDCRKSICELVHAPDPEQVIFTLNCTYAVNMVLKGFLKPGDHVVVSDLEHNAVMRPLTALASRNITYTVVSVTENDSEKTLSSFRNAIKENTKLVVCTQVSNVWGIRLPVERITAMSHQYGIPVLIDASQSAGTVEIDMLDSGFDFLCMPGHKGLYGPMGTGIMICSAPESLRTVIEGGTGSSSAVLEQPIVMPDKFESGTPNVSGIAGLNAGVNFVKKQSCQRILYHEISLLAALYDRLSELPNVILYTQRPDINTCGGVLSFNVKNTDCEEAAMYLSEKYGIAVRAGLHCSPLAHKHFNTEKTGTVRVSPSYYTSVNDINMLVKAVYSMK
ncbi:MAG: aminotransferase class V-fold PLP-dependent enzyme [Clostridia bacterium]|nr:aminotransferase class V-fold PLP-dependent enzyme [Clostridia bacterium]